MKRITTTIEQEQNALYQEKLHNFRRECKGKLPDTALECSARIQTCFLLWLTLERISNLSAQGYSLTFENLWNKFLDSDEGIAVMYNSLITPYASFESNMINYVLHPTFNSFNSAYRDAVDSYVTQTLWLISECIIQDYDYDLYLYNYKINHNNRDAINPHIYRQSNVAWKEYPIPPSNDLTRCVGKQFEKDLGKFEFTIEEFRSFTKSNECLKLYQKPFINSGQAEKFLQIVITDKAVQKWIHENANGYHYNYAAPQTQTDFNNYNWVSMRHRSVTNRYYENSFPFKIK